VGNLKIYTQEIGSSSSANQKEGFSISGNQGDAWLRGQFEVGVRQKSFRVIFPCLAFVIKKARFNFNFYIRRLVI
jgi:hypothetical protein